MMADVKLPALRDRARSRGLKLAGVAEPFALVHARTGEPLRTGLSLAEARHALRTDDEVRADEAAARAALTAADWLRLQQEAADRMHKAEAGWMAKAPAAIGRRVLDQAALDRIDRQARGGR